MVNTLVVKKILNYFLLKSNGIGFMKHVDIILLKQQCQFFFAMSIWCGILGRTCRCN